MNTTNASTNDEQVLVRTFYLLSRAATIGVCRGRMRAVIQHLTELRSATGVSAAVREMSEKLLVDWRAAQAEHFAQDAAPAEKACHCLH
ncbi:hypothetical protein [Rhodocyclus tenuis]|uniref:TFIIS N-terminal domain-containing protein n=1 Tax=Rhodocyclus tenuis TaxID=1066 RepID=A0A840G8M8_RHOTE|nr:hypothetical protein [Rhodocyclus tenuis]MBB4248693.1 hypothetical protein [Rhodocyclus tenuis]MBK1680868.1 hypothetical protein [Rhodocyclus tenuis]